MRKSRASFGCLSLADGEGVPRLSKSLVSLSGVRGGVDISEPLLVGAKRGHGIGREKFNGLIAALGDFSRERNFESVKYLSGEEVCVCLVNTDARLPVTQSDDPLSGGHFAVGASKAPLGRHHQHARHCI
jgi:hypothetical protein